MNKRWNEQERDFIRKNAGLITDAEGAKQLSAMTGRPISVHSWRKQRQKLQMAKAPGRGVCKLAGKAAAATLTTGQDAVTLPSEAAPTGVAPAQTTAIAVVPDGSGVGCAKHYDF